MREAFFSNEYYTLVWGKRIGFAKVATEAQVVSSVCSSCSAFILTDSVNFVISVLLNYCSVIYSSCFKSSFKNMSGVIGWH